MKHLFQSILFFFLVLAFAGAGRPCHAEITKLTGEDRRNILNIIDVRTIKTVRELPKPVVDLCTDRKGRMVDPAEEWGGFDVMFEGSRPAMRLIWAATGSGYTIVHFEKGGLARSHHILIAGTNETDSSTSFIWKGIGAKFANFEEFMRAFENNDLDDSSDYTH